MVFITLALLLGGLALLFSAVEDKSIADYVKQWIGG
jgi:hypothetical protein